MSEPLEIDALEDLALELRRHADPRPVSRRRRALVVLAPAAAALGVLAVLVLPGGGARPVDALAEARAALDPKDTILHYEYAATHTSHFYGQRHQQPPVSTEGTVWSTAGRWRYLNPHYLQSGRSNGRQESSFADGVGTGYTAGARSQRVTEGITDPAAATPPDMFGVALDLRAVLTRGAVADLGMQVYAGRKVRRLQSVQRRGRIHRPVYRITYDVDPTTFTPRHIRVALRFQGRTERSRYTTDVRVVRFERLPRTPANLRLLTIPVPPGTAVTKSTTVPGRKGVRKVCARPKQPGLPLCP